MVTQGLLFTVVFLLTNSVFADVSCENYYFEKDLQARSKVQYLTIPSQDGSQSLELRTSEAYIESARSEAETKANLLTQLAMSTESIQPSIRENAVASSIESLKRTVPEVVDFLESNPILNDLRNNALLIDDAKASKKDTKKPAANDKNLARQTSKESPEASIQNIDESARDIDILLVNLNELGAISSKALSVSGVISKIPFVGKSIQVNLARKYVTVREKIENIDRAIVNGAIDLHRTKEILNHQRGLAREHSAKLTKEIIYLRFMAEKLDMNLEELRVSDPYAAEILETEIIPRVQRQLGNRMGLFSIMVVAQEVLKQTNAVYDGLIENANNLRTIVAPTITVNTTLQIAMRKAELMMLQHNIIRKTANEQLKQTGKTLERITKGYYQIAGQTILDPVVLEGLFKVVQKQVDTKNEKMKAATLALRESNAKLTAALNTSLKQLDKDNVNPDVQEALLLENDKKP